MSEGKEFSYVTAGKIAMDMCGKFMSNPCVSFALVAGSLRRGNKKVKDADLIVIAETEDYEKVWASVSSRCKHETRGPVSRRFYYKGLKIDVRIFKHRHKGAALLTRTGPAGFNIRMRARAKRRGLLLNEYGIHRKNINLTPGFEEEQLFEFLGMEYIPPPLRGTGGKVKTKGAEKKEWIITSSDGVTKYTVTLVGDTLQCDKKCKGFEFRQTCRHVKEVQAMLEKKGRKATLPKKHKSDDIAEITVRCTPCDAWKNENRVESLTIEEDFQGKDLLTFICPDCGAKQQSRRYAKR